MVNMYQQLIAAIKNIKDYFENKRFEVPVGNRAYKCNAEHFIQFTELQLDMLNKSLSVQSNFSPSQIQELNNQIDSLTQYLSNFHEPLLTGVEERFKERLYYLVPKIRHLLLVRQNIIQPFQQLIAAIKNIKDYFENKRFKVPVGNREYKCNVEYFTQFTELQLDILNKSLSVQSNFSPSQIQELNNQIDSLTQYLSNFHEPLLTGVEEQFKERFARIATNLKNLQPSSLIDSNVSHELVVEEYNPVTEEILDDQTTVVTQEITPEHHSTVAEKQELQQKGSKLKSAAATAALIFSKTKTPRKQDPSYADYSTSIIQHPNQEFRIYDYVSTKKFMSSQPWLDIPDRLELESKINTFNANDETKSLLFMIDSYHTLNKTSQEHLIPRIKLLGFIHRYLLKHQGVLLKHTQEYLLAQTCSKALYLAAIYERLEQYDLTSDQNVANDQFTKGRYNGLEVTKSIVDGDELLTIDPCFRHNIVGNNTFNKLHEEWLMLKQQLSVDNTLPSFYLWLENKDLEIKKIHYPANQHPTVCSFATATGSNFATKLLKATALKIINNNVDTYFANSEQKPLNIDDTTFVLTSKYTLHISYNLTTKQRVGGNHPHIVGNGIPVLCAGHLSIENGKITKISNNSGHYKPTIQQLWQTLCLLNKLNLMNDNAIITIHGFTNGTWVEYAKQFLEIKGCLVADPHNKVYPIDKFFPGTKQMPRI